MGIEFVKAKVARLSQGENQQVAVRYEAQESDGGVRTRPHDLVVLSLGMVPEWNPAGICAVGTGEDAFIRCTMPKTAPTLTTLEGVFVAGVAAGPKDIVDTIVEAGAAAMEASNYLHDLAERKAA
jgi:heterodisulfide reductase subunit A